MSLTDDIEASKRRPGGTCTVPAILAALGDEAPELLAALESDASSMSIARDLAKRNLRIGDYTLTRHRNGTCRCP